MTTFDLTPLYRHTIGFDQLASLLENPFRTERINTRYPPYNVELIDKDRYTISIAVAGFTEDELEIQVERDVLTVKGRKAVEETEHHFLYQGIATRVFEHQFNLSEHVEVSHANFKDGLLIIELKREIPDALKPKHITINTNATVLEHQPESGKAA